MKKFGTYLVIGGIGSGILSLFGYNFKLLLWIDLWGETVGWFIRFGLVAAGALMVALPDRSAANGPLAKG